MCLQERQFISIRKHRLWGFRNSSRVYKTLLLYNKETSIKVMKNNYINYMGRMKEIEDNISKEDREVLENFLKHCSLSCGNEKLEQRKRFSLQFLDIAETNFKNFNREIIEHIYTLIKNSEREVSGKNETVKNLKYFIRWLNDDENLLKGIKAIPQRKGYNTRKLNPSTLVTDEEIEILIRTCKNHKEVALVTLQIELGLRPHELLALKWKDIKIDDEVGEIKIYANKTRDTRVLPFKTSIIHVLRWKDGYGFPNRADGDLVFPNPYVRNKQLYKSYLSYLYRRLAKNSNLRHIYPYLARHTRLTKMNGKLPSKVASVYGGHSEKTASIYTHLNDDDIREVVLKNIYDIKEPDIKDRKKLEKDIINIQKRLLELEEYKSMIKIKN